MNDQTPSAVEKRVDTPHDDAPTADGVSTSRASAAGSSTATPAAPTLQTVGIWGLFPMAGDTNGLAALARKIAAVMAAVTPIPATGHMDAPGRRYDYATSDAMLDVVRPLLAAQRLAIVPACVEARPGPKDEGYVVGLTYSIIDGDTGAMLAVQWTGAVAKTDSPLPKALTAATKSFLNQLLLLSEAKPTPKSSSQSQPPAAPRNPSDASIVANAVNQASQPPAGKPATSKPQLKGIQPVALSAAAREEAAKLRKEIQELAEIHDIPEEQLQAKAREYGHEDPDHPCWNLEVLRRLRTWASEPDGGQE